MAKPLHPYFIAAFIVTSLYAANVAATPWRDVPLPLAASLGLAVLLVFAMRILLRHPQRSALAASFALILTFSYARGYFLAQRFVTFEIPRRYSLAIYGLLLVAGIIAIRLAPLDENRFTRICNRFAMLMVIASLLTIGANLARHQTSFDSTATEERIVLRHPPVERDIYYLVFDRYAGHRTLQEDFGFDNSAFLNELSERGFHVAENSHTNYPKTVMAMSAALNLRYHDETIRSEYFYAELLRRHRVGRLLREIGYEYHHFGNWYYPLRSNENADSNFRISRLPSEFADVLYKLTPLGHTDTADLTRTWGDTRIPKLKFDAVARLARDNKRPKFVYAHFLLPHPPFVLDRDGTPLSRSVLLSRGKKANYVNQLIYTNRRIVALVDAIQNASVTPPIIIIQADEGPELYDMDAEKSWRNRCRKRTGILSAFCLPDVEMQEGIPSTITPVNSFRLVFNKYFGAELNLLADRCYYWEHDSPFEPPRQQCIEITEEVLPNPRPRGGLTRSTHPHAERSVRDPSAL